MLIGVPREIKDKEFRAGMVPASVQELVKHGHQVLVQSGLGNGIGVSDADYQLAGASVVIDAAEIFERAELIVKVKEPQSQEIPLLALAFCWAALPGLKPARLSSLVAAR